MLELKNISKVYELGKPKKGTYLKVDALKNVSIKFRRSEFVSILGQSGCGKTTLLNIVGGLDKYTRGDLVINGRSTKSYTDKDWDTYRNHSIGFVFQSYNLIPHQTVLENVQLALTLSGVSKKERERRAKDVLKKVGLKDKIHSKPNQLSGGQMQRVAIARALVNDPDIILADEPTGALDSKTSVQIMDILKEISKEKLIIMVTHNPDLANEYSSRIINLKDGELVGDSNPVREDEDLNDDKLVSMTDNKDLTKSEIRKKNKKKRMSFFTALSLSFKNLLTKKARTILVSFAGSIGIIGIALILSLSSGFQAYIDRVQNDTLSTYPITINAATVDYSAMLEMVMNTADNDNKVSDPDKIYSDDVIVNLFKNILQGAKTNNLKEFKKFIDNDEELQKYVAGIQYTYSINMNIYGRHTVVDAGVTKEITTQLTPNTMFQDGVMAFFDAVAEKEIPNRIEGVVDDTIINNYVKSELGITNPDHMMTPTERQNFELMKSQLSDTEKQSIISGCSESDRNAVRLMVRPTLKAQIIAETMAKFNSATSSGGTTMGDLNSMGSDDLGVWNEMLDNPKMLKSQYDVIAIEDGADKDRLFDDLKYNEIVLVVDEDGNLSDYNLYALGIKTSPTIEEVASGLANNMKDYTIEPSYFNHSDVLGKTYPLILETDFYQKLDNSGNIVDAGDYVDIRTMVKSASNMSGTLTETKYNNMIDDLIDNRVDGQNKIDLRIKAIIKAKEGVSATSIGGAIGYSHLLTEKIISMQNAEITRKGMDATMVQTIDIENPTSVNIYCTDFESKAEIERLIAKYNESKSEEDKISYTDFVGIMMSSISTIINAISYVLIAFVSISLVVSSIMIGIITYISVLERIKEIGVLRSVGASKKDVKRVFTAESLIIGTASGVLGILVTLLLNIPINIIINALAGLSGVASLPIGGAFILIGISMLLTFIAGLIPAHLASKKDPVIALRTE